MASSSAPRHTAPPANRIRPERSSPLGRAVPRRRPPVVGDDPRHGGLRDAEDPRSLGGRLTSREDALGDLGALLGCPLATSAAPPPSALERARCRRVFEE